MMLAADPVTPAKLDPDLCRELARKCREGSMLFEGELRDVVEQLTAAAEVMGRHAEVDALCAKMGEEHRLDLQRICQLADALRSAGIPLPEGIPNPAPALTADEVRAVVREAFAQDGGVLSEQWALRRADAIAARVAEKLARRAVDPAQRTELREAFLAGCEHCDGWIDENSRLAGGLESDEQAAAEYARSKAGGQAQPHPDCCSAPHGHPHAAGCKGDVP